MYNEQNYGEVFHERAASLSHWGFLVISQRETKTTLCELYTPTRLVKMKRQKMPSAGKEVSKPWLSAAGGNMARAAV